MIDHVKFAEEYDGVKINFPGVPGVQCVGLARYWLQKNGIPRHEQPATTPSAGAKDLVNNVSERYTPRLRLRRKGEDPQPGDLVVWGATKGNKWGHVALLMEINGEAIEVLQQDGFNQSIGTHWAVYLDRSNITGYICIKD